MEKKTLKVTVKQQAAVNLFNFGSLLLSYQLLIRGGGKCCCQHGSFDLQFKEGKEKENIFWNLLLKCI